MTDKKKIYFDHSATTPMDPEALAAMRPYFTQIFGNPSSLHAFGQAALAGVDKAREEVAGFLGCSPDEVVFTSGATESDNLAVNGLLKALTEQGRKRDEMHVITSAVEHDAVLEPLYEQERKGLSVTRLGVDKRGMVDPAELEKALNDRTVLVSVMHVNSEVGTIQPLRAIGKIIRKFNDRRLAAWQKRGASEKEPKPGRVYFHTDATQAVNFYNSDVGWFYLDMLSLSGHKIYGPKGAGALYVRAGTPLAAVQRGGHHERDRRSGTLNVPGIVGLGAAVAGLGKSEKGEPSPAQAKANERIARLRDYLADGIIDKIPAVKLNTYRECSSPAHAHFTFFGVEGESVLIALDLEGIAVSTGSACASGSLKASHVLLAMGIKAETAHNSIRFTLGKNNTKAEIDHLLKVLPPIIARLRKMNPLLEK